MTIPAKPEPELNAAMDDMRDPAVAASLRAEEFDALRPAGNGGREIAFGYTNYRRETSHRRVRPISIRYGHNEYHKDDGWLLLAFDLDKYAIREFAMRDMILVEPADAILALTPAVAPDGARAALEEIIALTKEYADAAPNVGLGAYEACATIRIIARKQLKAALRARHPHQPVEDK